MLTEILDKTLGMIIYLFTSLEGWSFNFSLIYVILSIKQNKYAWGFAIISSILYGIVCIDYKMYPTAGLQLFFVLSSVYGFIQWSKPKNKANQTNNPQTKTDDESWNYTKLSKNAWFLFTSLTILLAGIISMLLVIFAKVNNNISFYIESFAAGASLIAQYLLARKCIHNWNFWFAVNIAYVFVNIYQSLYFMAILYGIFVILSIQGYISWQNKSKNMLKQQELKNDDDGLHILNMHQLTQKDNEEQLIQHKQMA